ncbi:hypothetical protein HJC23_005143 [Cyclotella cryptica]|uniref:Uncharacterized protein n=1 Tax=Cyclotella cryptica TaxID=29204 RepID=A0ABD3QGT7_9STRA|eukprot:CCRYP_005844-RA/>CCRYP_005844-RA protein AED:0.05 eAED:0.05 QI:114/1/1/1/0.5/0.4/5/1030/309
MKSHPKLSPYGVFTGKLFQYHANLVAFESSPPTTSMSRNKCILIGGLSDGLIPTPYTSDLEKECHSLGWSLVQPLLSSSYLGFGSGSLSRDTSEIELLMNYLVCHHDADFFTLVGHSTGCQNSIHFLKHGDTDMVKKVKFVALQAPVSDRESMSLTPGNHDANLEHAKSLLSQHKGEEMMPRSTFWAPITASRYLDLFDVKGDDDFFSSDLSDEELHERLGHIGNLGKKTGLRLLAVFSGKDEYVPETIEKEVLLERLVTAMNGGKRNHGAARGLLLKNANHNLSDGSGDKEIFVKEVGNLLRTLSADS